MTTPTPSAMRGLLVAACALATASAGAQLRMPGNSSATPSLAAPPVTAPARAAAPAAPAAQAPATDETTLKENAGQLAALGWLMLLDRRDWGTAWESSSQVFRTQVPIAAWMDAIPKVREPLGPLAGREPVETAYKTALPGRPAGDYVTVVFASRFANKPDLQEIVTTARDADGRWRVLGYSTR
ncbi:MAG: DUF4019 domain-containing protein [Ramlibacter sp.]|nr:DUF4019 domain-containing protein [Ramlibacter sp.]